MTKVSDLFDVRNGHSLELNRLKQVGTSEGIAFVSRTTRSNGVVAYVEHLSDETPAPAGELTCALSGNGVLSTFLQDRPFYTAYHVARLTPKEALTKGQLLYYCMCIKANRHRYSFGRQANRTLKDILVPGLKEIPDYVETVAVDPFAGFAEPQVAHPLPTLDVGGWQEFALSELFNIKKGKRITKANMKPGPTPFISAIDSNNGLRQYIDVAPQHPANLITVNYNGNGVAEAYLQTAPFCASDDVNVLYPKFELDPPIAMFVCTLIRAEKYRFSYGRKWALERMKVSTIRLPATKSGGPDWKFMRTFISRLPFSSRLAA